MNHGAYAELIRMNLDKTTLEIANALGITYQQVRYIQRKFNIYRSPELSREVIIRKNKQYAGSRNGNWKGGISSEPYHYKKRSISKHRDKHLARRRFQYAYKSGKIQRKPCEVCGEPVSEAHHPDYSQPLNVIWLCRYHHILEHKNMVNSHENQS